MRLVLLKNPLKQLTSNIGKKFTLSSRIKGTFIERWTNYWRAIVSDYSEVALDLVKESYAKPRKTLVIGITSYGLYQCNKRNPSMEDLMEHLRKYNNQMMMISPSLQNPESVEYLNQLEQAINQNTLRTLSLGICILLWIDLYDKNDCTYPAICEYTKVGYWNLHERIVDIGFLNKFWRLDWKMRNFDVNYL